MALVMLRTMPAVLLVGLVLLAACRPQEVVVEVTRLVKEQNRVAVTRVVTETVVHEATRLLVEKVEVVMEVTREPIPLGSELRPVQLLFPPRFEAATIMQRTETLAESLGEATGYQFRVGILDSEQTVIDVMCAAPADSIGFLSPGGYVLANEQCDVQAGSVAVGDDGLTTKMGMLVARDDSGIADLSSLPGKQWAVADENSLSSYFYFQALMRESGIEPGEMNAVSGGSVAMLAVHAGEVDLAAAEFIPPILPYEERLWDPETDDPEPWRALGLSPNRSGIGYIVFNGDPQNGGYRLRDARSRIFDVEPEIYDDTLIVALSEPIPNDTVVFGREIPFSLAKQIEAELVDFSESELCISSLCSTDFYGWHGLAPAEDEMYEPVRFIRQTLGLTAEELLKLNP